LQRRRRLAAARAESGRRAVRRRRRLRRLAGGVAALVVVGAVLTVAESRTTGGHPPSPELRAELVKGASGALAMGTVPAGYHAVYRSESYDGATATLATEDLSVRRPFDGRVTIREGTTPAGARQFEGRSTLGSYGNYTESGPGQVSGDAPTVAFGDVRLASSIDDLLAKGLFVLRERRRTLGRECQVYRTGTALQSLKITAPTPTDYADACLDESGLVLETVTVVGGKTTQHLTATELVVDPAFEPSTFTVDGDPVAFDQGGSVLTPLDAAVAPVAGFWQLEAPPAGFDHRGRYQLQSADQGDPGSGRTVTTYADVYVRGTDIVVLRQGPVGGEPDLSSAASGGDPADLGPLGQGRLMFSTIGPVLSARPGTDTFVHLSGTVTARDLQAQAGTLRQS
jgi:hypothetical protein